MKLDKVIHLRTSLANRDRSFSAPAFAITPGRQAAKVLPAKAASPSRCDEVGRKGRA
jgi:hypothetical protein